MIILTDVDDTLYKGDFWAKHTMKLLSNLELWEKLMQEFKPLIKEDPKGISEAWMNATLDALREMGITPDFVKFVANDVFEKEFSFYPQAIKFLRHKVNEGAEIVLCTANNDIAANIVGEKLTKILENATSKEVKIKILSSIVDWENFKVKRINVDDNKSKQVVENEIDLSKITHIFGDDPWVNDIGLFNINPSRSYLIKTEKNKDFSNDFLQPLTWEETLCRVM